MKQNALTDTTICLPAEDRWELWKQSQTGWQVVQTAALAEGGGPGSFKEANLFGFPVAAAFAVPIRAATGEPDLLPDLVDFQLEKQNLKPDTEYGKLMDYRTVNREEKQTLVLATVLNAQMADDLPRTAPQRFEVTPYLFYLPDNHLVIWKELGRIVFCVTRDDQPVYYHALSTPVLTADTVQEIEQLLMPLYTQEIIAGVEGILLWTDAVEPGAADQLNQTFGARVRSESRPRPAPPQEAWGLEPVSVALGKIRAARLRKARNIAMVCCLAYLAVPGYFTTRYFLGRMDISKLQGEVASLRYKFGDVENIMAKSRLMDGAINADKFPVELVREVLAPITRKTVRDVALAQSGVEVNHVGDVSEIIIKAETKTNVTVANRYVDNLKKNPLLAAYEWKMTADPPRDGKTPFTIKGSTKKEEDAGPQL